VKVFLCPGYKASMPGNSEAGYVPESDNFYNAYSYSICRSVSNAYWSLLPGNLPFGKQSAARPLRMTMIQQPSLVWAAADFDWDAVTDNTSLGGPRNYVARKPVHGKSRNFLYFDWHVSTVKVSTPDKFNAGVN